MADSKALIATADQVGHILTSRRKALKLSQSEMATRLGLSQNRYSELEQHPGKLTLDRLLILAAALNLDLALQEKGNVAEQTGEW